jgi:hypothetical protein
LLRVDEEEVEDEDAEAATMEKVLLRCGTAPAVTPSTNSQMSSRGGASLMGGGRLAQIWEYMVLSQVDSLNRRMGIEWEVERASVCNSNIYGRTPGFLT